MQGKLKSDYDIEIKPWKLRSILQRHMAMRYKGVNEVSWRANDPKNLLLRQQFAHAFLKLNLYGQTIINIDETWLGMTDFRRKKWTFTDRPDSVRKKQVQPRVSMITGLDTNGELYISLVQANSNGSVMQMFFINLLHRLDAANKDWRKHTVILLDGAKYHTSEVMMEFYKEYQVPVMFTGPHSYDASPIELFFAAFKSKDVNPQRLPTGKT